MIITPQSVFAGEDKARGESGLGSGAEICVTPDYDGDYMWDYILRGASLISSLEQYSFNILQSKI